MLCHPLARHSCGAIHGDRDQSERTTILRKFKAGEVSVLVATDIAARGLDIKVRLLAQQYLATKDV